MMIPNHSGPLLWRAAVWMACGCPPIERQTDGDPAERPEPAEPAAD